MEVKIMIISNSIKPISIRKLKKYYILRTTTKCIIVCPKNTLIIQIPFTHKNILSANTFINKKLVEEEQSKINRLNGRFHNIDVIRVLTYPSSLYDFYDTKLITLYSVFDTESSYLKWKLKL